MVGINDNLNLDTVRLNLFGNYKMRYENYLHGTSINKQSVQILGGFGSRVGFAEDDGGDAAASAILVVSEHDSLDGSCGFREVFLYPAHMISTCAHEYQVTWL